ncbi:histidine--tRNA ligase [Reyranella sp. CPCC 100927]|uniref:histidine--tRNA ligase n=1 Tax=Reyranella sp. CPCC 100927 TaxID=2599616 RepID=UPI0011B4730D|nr:histidine--tRNA ligase [Reyranella sp. CPCC 100927]TWT08731.1 histidine--tRNA ligase [Reyranella sp. CPCC 100927]
MSRLQPARGTRDILPDEFPRFAHVVDTARDVARLYGYQEMSTPIFEFTDLFARGIGETTDVVSKEMYSFLSRGDEEEDRQSLTLRPEYTAGICRAFISNGELRQQLPLKLFAHGPMFRYERPQAGRYRQFHQIDIEVLGAPEPECDVEVISVAADILDRLGILPHCVLKLNSLGDPASRAAYREVLVGYYRGHQSKLSKESLDRLERNPLRILDSKDEGDKAVNANAPSFAEHLNEASRSFFDAVRAGLDASGIAYEVDPALVRGLDYYTHTAFEFVTSLLGAQGTVIGGGRYDGLIELLGGPPTAGIGWAGGIDRLVTLVQKLEKEPPALERPVAIVPMGTAAEQRALALARDLRRADVPVELAYRGNMKRRLQRANKLNASHALIIGDSELAKGVVALKDLDAGTQEEVPFDEVVDALGDHALDELMSLVGADDDEDDDTR